MGKIRILPEHVYNRIAAGEVIDRPAAVVKELTENAIDAGAGNIKVFVEKAGSRLIRVVDDGVGMDMEDALQCLEPHATSKIFSENDINGILSYGFRGEAVPSIASVSGFSLKTRRGEDMEGIEVKINAGKVLSAEPAGCAPGTEVTVKSLFFNMPARKKFLRTNATEEKHIQEVLIQLALPNPAISFSLSFDGRSAFNSPAHDDLKPRIKTFFGAETRNALIPVKYSYSGIKVTGFTAKHGFTRNTRREQRVFINGRPVDAPAVYRGIKEGYGSLVEKGRFPPAVLFLTMNPQLVDVNVHPAKREVRFNKPYIVSGAVAEALKTALRAATGPSVSVSPSITVKAMLQGAGISYIPKEKHPEFELSIGNEQAENLTGGERPGIPVKTDNLSAPVIPPNINDTEEHKELFTGNRARTELPGTGPLKVIGFVENTYIIAVAASSLVLIDQHAAHERVLFEKLQNKRDGEIPSQKLLIPVTVELSRHEAVFMDANKEEFCKVGFQLESFGENTIIVHSVPAVLKQDNISGLIKDLVGEFSENGVVRKEANPSLIAGAACKAAVKANDVLRVNEAEALIKQMSECEFPFSCPHGRPTVINITTKELEKRFGRR